MPLKRNVIKVGNSRAVVIPADWLTYYEGKRGGVPIDTLLMEVNNIIIIKVDDTPPLKEDGNGVSRGDK